MGSRFESWWGYVIAYLGPLVLEGTIMSVCFILLLFNAMPAQKKNEQQFGGLQRHDKDTWSPEVQIYLLTDEIQHLQDHLDAHGKDYDAKRALLKKVAKRRSLLKYLKSTDLEVYASVAQQFQLKA